MTPTRRLLCFLRSYRSKLVVGALLAVLTNAAGVAAPWVLKLAVDGLRADASRADLLRYGLYILGIAAFAGVLRYAMRMVLIGMSREVELDLRNALFSHLQRLSSDFYNRHRTGDIINRLTSDLESVRTLLGPGIMYPLDTFTIAVFSVTMMLIISPKLTLLVLIATPVVSVAVYGLGRVTHRLHTRIQEQSSAMSACAQENLSGVRIVRAFAQEEREIGKFDALNREYVRRNLVMAKVQAMFFPILFLLFEIGMALILLIGGRGIIRGELTLGGFVAFVGYLGMLAWPMIAIGWVANLYQRGTASMRRLNEILEESPRIRQPENPRKPEVVRGRIVFEGVSSGYTSQTQVLTDLNLTIQPGSTVAFVGRTGSGKSTLVALLTRMIDPTSGRVLIDSVATTDWDLRALRRAIGVVPQDALLFSDTLRSNIAFGSENAAELDFKRAVQISRIDKDVSGFSGGYETRVGERGLTLSGGQKARATLARALLKNPTILVLDDALAAVDTQTEEEILHGLRDFMKQRTSIVISHRVSTVREADEIFVLEKGRIVEQGTHQQLIRRKGFYAELERLQRLEAELEAMPNGSIAS